MTLAMWLHYLLDRRIIMFTNIDKKIDNVYNSKH